MTKPQKLKRYRKLVDRISLKICELLNKRAAVALKIGFIKKHIGLNIYVPSREKAILRTIAKKNTGPLSNNSIRRIFRTVIKETRELENKKMH